MIPTMIPVTFCVLLLLTACSTSPSSVEGPTVPDQYHRHSHRPLPPVKQSDSINKKLNDIDTNITNLHNKFKSY